MFVISIFVSPPCVSICDGCICVWQLGGKSACLLFSPLSMMDMTLKGAHQNVRIPITNGVECVFVCVLLSSTTLRNVHVVRNKKKHFSVNAVLWCDDGALSIEFPILLPSFRTFATLSFPGAAVYFVFFVGETDAATLICRESLFGPAGVWKKAFFLVSQMRRSFGRG